jgi:hypothetical protein
MDRRINMPGSTKEENKSEQKAHILHTDPLIMASYDRSYFILLKITPKKQYSDRK